MQYFTKLITIFIFMNSGISYSQRNIPKTVINQNGVFVESIISSGGARKKGVMTFVNGDKIIGEWRNDTLTGLSKIIYKDGFIEQGKWSKGILKKKYDILEFYKDGTIKEACVDKVNGESNLYNVVGEPSSIRYYENSKLKYERFWYNNNIGFKKEVNYDEFGKLNGDYITYQEPIMNTDGKVSSVPYDTIGKYVNGKREGEWLKKYKGASNLNMSEFIYQNGIIISEIQYKYWNDQNIKEKEVFYLNNKIQKEVAFFENGAIGSETFYNDGFKVKTTQYENNGVIRGKKIYEDKYTTYQDYIDGILRSSTRTSNATLKREGYEISYYSNGKLNYKEFFKDDVSITYEGYFENGQKQYIEDLKKKEKYNENGDLVFYLDKTTKNGFITYESGEKWVGEIGEDEKTIGKGTYYYKNGDKYIGKFNENEDIADGQGEYLWSDGTKYVGNFKDGKPFGNGTKYWADGDKYIGKFNDNQDVADGQGEYYWQNGKRYIGNFKDGLINGYGKIINVDGSIQEGIFSNGNLVNDYNKKQISSSNTSNKSSTNPMEDIQNGLKELVNNPLIKVMLAQEKLYQAGSSSSSSTNSYTSSKRVFICSSQDGCCLSVVNSDNKPSEGICKSRSYLPAGQNGHSWREVGIQGGKSYMCNRCSVVVNISSYPSGGGCCPVGGCTGHSWSEVR